MAVDDLVQQIIDEGRYVPTEEEYYGQDQPGAVIPGDPFLNDEGEGEYRDAGICGEKPEFPPTAPAGTRCPQPGWPAALGSNDYAKSVEELSALARDGRLAYRHVVSEILRTIDCRLTELLFCLAKYPEENWVVFGTQMSFGKKLRMVDRLLPQGYVPQPLMAQVAEERNVVEHQYSDVSAGQMRSFRATMRIFFKVTHPLMEVIKIFSLFPHKLPGIEETVAVQYLRQRGRILVCPYGGAASADNCADAMTGRARRLTKAVVARVIGRIESDPPI